MVVDEWEKAELGNIADFVNGRAFKPADWSDTGIPIIRIQNLNGGLEYNYYEGPVEERYIIENGDLLFSWSGNRGTSFGPYIWNGPTGILNQHIFKVIHNKRVTKSYLHHTLRFITSRIEQEAHGGSGIVHIKKSEMVKFVVPVAPLEEQNKIAEILGSVDEAIAKTEAVISQTQKVKQGLLQSLLTKGIGHTKFKKTEIGEIPEEWTVGSIGELSDRVTSGSRGWAEYYSEDGAAFIRITNLKRHCIYPDLSDLKRVQLPAGSAEGVRTRIRTGDVLISITADLGIIGYIKDDSLGEAYVNQHISLVSFNSKKIHAGFASYFLSAPFMQRYIQKLNDGGAKAGLNLPTIRKLPLPLPVMKEQVDIFQTLKEVDDYLLESKEQVLSLKNLKKGTMSDLLTGRVRVRLDKKNEKAA